LARCNGEDPPLGVIFQAGKEFVVEGCSINQKLRIVMSWLVHLEAEVNDLDKIVLEDVRFKNKGILAVFFALLVGPAAGSHGLNDEQDFMY
jgi:hypothetical protein